MPSPFPGIDPFIESQGYWQDFHSTLMTHGCDALNENLPEPYEARMAEQPRLVDLADAPARVVLPDVAVVHPGGMHRGTVESEAPLATGEPLVLDLPTDELEEVRDLWIEIRHRPDRNVVTAIEILSPSKKLGEGYREYRAKRRRLIRQQVHVVEVDLLIAGRRLEMEQRLPPADCYAFISRADRRPRSEVYAWSICQPLPRIPIPLLAPDPELFLDLPSLFTLGYDRGRYARALNYAAPLELPLAPGDRAWAEERARKVRS